MTLFIDASAIVAMIGREPEASTFAEIVAHHDDRATSAVAVWESVLAVSRVRNVYLDEVRMLVADFLRDGAIRLVPIAAAEADLAIDAHLCFGKGRHAAQLNMGDCFAYACTRQLGADILFKGSDFIETDLRDATLT